MFTKARLWSLQSMGWVARERACRAGARLPSTTAQNPLGQMVAPACVLSAAWVSS